MLLAEFDTAEEAYWFEQTSIDNSWGDPLLINQRNQKHYDKALILCSHSQRTKDKISAANTGRILSPEHCRHISEALRELTLARNELKLFRKIVEDQEKDLKTMTVWKLIRKRISEWIRP